MFIDCLDTDVYISVQSIMIRQFKKGLKQLGKHVWFLCLDGILFMHCKNSTLCKTLIQVITMLVIVPLLYLNLVAKSKCGKLCLNFIRVISS